MDVFTIRGTPEEAVSACQKILKVIQQGSGDLVGREITLKIAAPSLVTQGALGLNKENLAGIIGATKATVQFSTDEGISNAIDNLKSLLDDLKLVKKVEGVPDVISEVQSDSGVKDDEQKAKSPAATVGALRGILKPNLLKYTRDKILELQNSRNIPKDVPLFSVSEVIKRKTVETNGAKANQQEAGQRFIIKGDKTEPGPSSKSMPRRPLASILLPRRSVLNWTADILSNLAVDNVEASAFAFSSNDPIKDSDAVAVVELVFSYAVEVPNRATMYAKWISRVVQELKSTSNGMEAKKFREAVVLVCRQEFQKAVVSEDKKSWRSEATLRRNKFCLALFTGSLYKLMAFSPKIMVDWIQVLVDLNAKGQIHADDDALQCLCKLLKCVGGLLVAHLRNSRMSLKIAGQDGQVAKVEFDDLFVHLKKSLKKILALKTRILLEELIELHENNWQPRDSHRLLNIQPIIPEVVDNQKEVELTRMDTDTVQMTSSQELLEVSTELKRVYDDNMCATSKDASEDTKEPEIPADQTTADKEERLTSSSRAPKSQEASDIHFSFAGPKSWTSASSVPLHEPTSLSDCDSRSQAAWQLPATSYFSSVVTSPPSVWETFEERPCDDSFFNEIMNSKDQQQFKQRPWYQSIPLEFSPKSPIVKHADSNCSIISDKELAFFIFRKYFETGSYDTCEDLIVDQFGELNRQQILLDFVARRACETWSMAEQESAGEFVRLMVNSERPELANFNLEKVVEYLVNGGIMNEIKQNLRHSPRGALSLATFVAEVVREVPTFDQLVGLAENWGYDCSYEFAEAIFRLTASLLSEFLLVQ